MTVKRAPLCFKATDDCTFVAMDDKVLVFNSGSHF
jgi:hypothetical protein